jgi:flagellar basal-body rod protein FlgC
MGMFAAMDIAISGATVSRTWMDAISHNIANLNTDTSVLDEPFRALVVEAQSVRFESGERGGVAVSQILERGAEPSLVFDPNNPLALNPNDLDPVRRAEARALIAENPALEGLVQKPVVDLGQEMTNLVIASRTYEANLGVVDRMRDAYMAALRIGQR